MCTREVVLALFQGVRIYKNALGKVPMPKHAACSEYYSIWPVTVLPSSQGETLIILGVIWRNIMSKYSLEIKVNKEQEDAIQELFRSRKWTLEKKGKISQYTLILLHVQVNGCVNTTYIFKSILFCTYGFSLI